MNMLIFLIKKLTHKIINYKEHILSLKIDFLKIKNERGITNSFKFLFRKIYIEITNKLCFLPALLLTLIVISIRPYKKIIFIRLYGAQFGHYVFNTELILNCINAKIFPKDQKKWFMFYNMHHDFNQWQNQFIFSRKFPICNKQLHKMWKRTIFIVPLYYLAYTVDRYLCLFLGEPYSAEPLRLYSQKMTIEDLYGMLAKSEPTLKLNHSEINQGQRTLQKMGVEADAHYVCLFVRDEKYNQDLKGTDGMRFRNADINNYKKAAIFLANAGYYVIRMGSAAKKPFITNNHKIIDYATSQYRSDFMDIYIPSNCFFYITTASGLDSLAHVFRKPILCTDLVFPCFKLYSTKQYIFKKFIKNNQLVLFNEIYSLLHNVDWFYVDQILLENDITLVDNTEMEIFEAVQEMLLDIQGNLNRDPMKKYFELQRLCTDILIRAQCHLPSLPNPICNYSFLVKLQAAFFYK